jgi:hypothetical protein
VLLQEKNELQEKYENSLNEQKINQVEILKDKIEEFEADKKKLQEVIELI